FNAPPTPLIYPLSLHDALPIYSKQLSEKKRMALRPVIENEALDFAVASVSAEEIDRINILNASYLAMHRALDQLKTKAAYIIVDGNRFKAYQNTPHQCIVKADGKYCSIAAASILAKTYRDEYMQQLACKFPHYDWLSSEGYPTIKHRNAILEYRISPHHRKSFRVADPLPKLL